MTAAEIVTSIAQGRKWHAFARLRDGIHVSGPQLRTLATLGAVQFDYLRMRWMPTPEVLAEFNARFGTVEKNVCGPAWLSS